MCGTCQGWQADQRQQPLTLVGQVSPALFGSLADNALCGINEYGGGTYTAEGINALCEGLKGSAITTLRCAAPVKDGRPTSVSSR